MTDEEALRAAVLAHPYDDTPRLVYADWCDDAGHADRAAFIRAQIDAARAEPWGAADREAMRRANALLAVYAEEWTAHVSEAVEWHGFERGFIEQVGLYAHRFARGLDEACRAEPVRRAQLIRGLAQVNDSPLEEVLTSPHLSQLHAFDLHEATLTASVEFEFVTEHDQLAGLTDLSLAGLRVPPDWLMRFLAGPHLPALVALDLSNIPNLGPALARGLMEGGNRRFTKLNLTGVRLLSNDLKGVLSSRALGGVEELRLGWSFPGPGPVTMLELGWVMPWARLRLLDLTGQQLGPDGVKEITRERAAAGLRWLGLARNHLGSAGAEWLLESRHLNLYHLDVSDNGLSPPLLAALRARFPDALVIG